MIVHVVFFKFKNENKEANILKVRDGLEALEMKELKKLEVGINFDESERSWDLSLITEFENIDDLDAYQNYTPHVEIKKMASLICESIAIVDYKK